MAKVVIGVHGLGNKPSKDILSCWWRKAIDEGLRYAQSPRLLYKFDLVYWANHLYTEPLDPAETDLNSLQFIREVYLPNNIFKKEEPPAWWRKTLDYVEKQLDKMFLNKDMTINFSSISDYILKRYFRDLSIYYEINQSPEDSPFLGAKKRIRQELASILESYKGNEIMLIAHSMGSIVAYDVLIHLTPHIEIDTFVTLGSPLGLPVIISKIFEEQKKALPFLEVRTPENITRHWYNLSDLDDRVAINYNLNDDYEANSRQIKPVDYIVQNNYEIGGISNPHKSFGYLRTPQMAKIFHEFLDQGRSKTALWVSEKANHFFCNYIEESANSIPELAKRFAGNVKENILDGGKKSKQ